MCGETQTSRWNDTCHESIEQTRRVFIRSLGDEEHMDLVERVVAECLQEDTEYEWSYGYDESEFPEFVRRSVRRMFPL